MSTISVSIGTGVGCSVLSRLQQSELFREYQQAFEATTGFPLVLRESGSFQTPLQGSKRMNPFCALMTQTNKTCSACLQLQQRVEAEATQEPKTLQCYAGLSESAVPLRVGDMVLGYLQTGQVFLRAPSKRHFKGVTRLMVGGESAAARRNMESAYFQTRVVTRKQYESIIRLLVIFAEHLATVSNQILIREAAAELPVIAKSRAFIAEHHGEALCLGDAARAVHMSAFYFCKVFKHATGLTFTAYLARVRIEAVKQSLLNLHTRVSEAAFAAGFQSLSQFNRIFHRVVGEAPSSYRDRLHGLNGKSGRNGVLVRAA
jgi:AraC-like DNA-binding protein/ligand-binding sensor protein